MRWRRFSEKLGHRTAFTLVELLVVIAIIGILVALLLPAVQAARESARRAQCLNNFKQVGVAHQLHHSTYRMFPHGITMWTTGLPCTMPPGETRPLIGWSWGAYILPFMEETEVYQMYEFGKAGSGTGYADPPQNFQASGSRIRPFLCPSDPQGDELVGCCSDRSNGGSESEDMGRTNMSGVADSRDWQCLDEGWPSGWPRTDADGVLFQKSKVSTAKITDGTSNTLLVGEVIGYDSGSNAGYWWAAWNIMHTANGINLPRRVTPSGLFRPKENGFASYHIGGCHFAFCDGSAAFIDEYIDQSILAAITTRANGDIIGEGDWR